MSSRLEKLHAFVTAYFVVLAMSLVALQSSQAMATPFIFGEWKKRYPESRSGQRECQLCHAFERGGDPWNAYGIEVRYYFQQVYNFDNVDLALRDVEQADSDDDPEQLTNLQEINLGLDPGWAPGPVNIYVYKNGDVVRGKAPPFVEGVFADESIFCFPIVSADKRAAVICL